METKDMDTDFEAEKNQVHTLLSVYLREVNKYKLLTREEEFALARRSKQNDLQAKEMLVNSNLRFVIKLAGRYRSSGLSLMDLISEGNLGLLRAVEKFDPDMKVRFVSYASWSIRQAILQAIQQRGHPVRMPMNQKRQLQRIVKEKQIMEAADTGKINLEILANVVQMKVKEVVHLLDMSRSLVSLDHTQPGQENTSLIDSIEDKYGNNPSELVEQAEMKHKLNECLLSLSPQERSVLKMRHGFGKHSFSLKEIGQMLKLSSERVRQIEEKATRKIRQAKNGAELFSYLRD